MARGLDYAFSHPSLPCIVQAGYSFVARYIGDPDPNPLKYLDAAEVHALRLLEIDIVVVRETTAGFMLTESGTTHAQVSRAHCNALGLHGIPIYYALDVDPRSLTTAQRAAVTRFLQDAAAADGGGHNVGLYGSDDAIDAWVGQSYCQWGWQTFAWSGGRISPKAHFRQHNNGVTVCGGTVDLNETYAADFGQWPRPDAPPPDDDLPEEDDDMFILIDPSNNTFWAILGTNRVQVSSDFHVRARDAGFKVIAPLDADADAILTGTVEMLEAVKAIDVATGGGAPFPDELNITFSGAATAHPAAEA